MADYENKSSVDHDEDRISRLSGGSQRNQGDVVQEYEARYTPQPKQKAKRLPRSYSTDRVESDDRLWAAVAHGSVWITFLMAVPTSGISMPFVVFIPLVIYALFRKRSDYIAFHALQAFVLQLICTVGALMVFTVGGVIWVVGLVFAALLMLVLVGFVILPLWVIAGMIMAVAASLLPLAGLLFATIAIVRIYTGGDYRYPYIADWVDRQMAGGFLNT